uniref:Uncharacterized protein n=1 Tax=Laticauda laticaudata TaxID=8630 RepID=A0A8C5WWI2_LATLA
HLQGKIVLPDLFRLSQMGNLSSGFAPAVSGRLLATPRFPDLALEADLHGNHRCAKCPFRPHPFPGDLHCRCCPLHYPPSPPASCLAHHFRRGLSGGDCHVLVRLGDWGRGSRLALHPGGLLGGLLRASGGGLSSGWGEPPSSPGRGSQLQPPVEDSGVGATCGRGGCLQRSHHRHRHRSSLLLHHRALCQVREDRGPQHRPLHPLHPDGQHSPAEHHGAAFVHPQPDFLLQGAAGGAAGRGGGPRPLSGAAEKRTGDAPPQRGQFIAPKDPPAHFPPLSLKKRGFWGA